MYTTRNGKTLTYEAYMAQVNKMCLMVIGLGYEDLADYNTRDLYNSGASPKECLIEILRHDDVYSVIAEDL